MKRKSIKFFGLLMAGMLGICTSVKAETLSAGSSGSDVKAMQEKLIQLGFLEGIADGAFGNQTKAAVEEFQKANSLDVTGVIEDKEKALLLLGDECGFSKEYAKRAAVVAMTNGQASDVFSEDGSSYDTSKFHSYADTEGFYMTICSEGEWSQGEGNIWHVEGMILRMEEMNSYLKASMNIDFDGKNYIVSDVTRSIAGKEEDLNNPDKTNTEKMNPSHSNPFLTVSPELLKNGRSEQESIQEKATLQKSEEVIDSERASWVESQFSWWDGSHNELEKLIKANLNDEKSYDHIDTTYIDITDDEKLKLVNETLSSAGYTQRAEMGDLLIITEFSAKNSFNATVKSTAIGIASYKNDVLTLVGIE